MANYITIDGGTTNTRISMVSDNKILQRVHLNIGAKDNTIGASALKSLLKEGISEIIKTSVIEEGEITAIIACGMITSERGLYELPHIKTPAGIAELHNEMKRVKIDEISSVPFYLIPGIMIKGEDLLDTDIIRGEETEIMGLLEGFPANSFLLPGSHSKLISLNTEGKIVSCRTMMSGEMIAALSDNTILKSSVDLKCKSIDEKYLELGFDTCREIGLNAAIFKTRILKSIFGAAPTQCYSYYLGVIFSEELRAIKEIEGTLFVGGKGLLKNPLAALINKKTDIKARAIPDFKTDYATAIGAVRIFEYKGRISSSLQSFYTR